MTMRVSKDRIDMDDNVLKKAVLQDYGETIVGGATGANTGSSYTIDLTQGNAFHLVLTANCTFTFSSPAASGTATSFVLYLQQDSNGSRTATWPSAVEWPADTAPTLTTTANHLDIFTFITIDGGTTWFGATSAQSYTTSITIVDDGDAAPSSGTGTSSHTYNSETSTGPASVVMFTAENSAAFTLSSATWNGSSVDILFQDSFDAGSGTRLCAGFLYASGAQSGNIVLNWSTSVVDSEITIVSLTNLVSSTTVDTDSHGAASVTPVDLDAISSPGQGGIRLAIYCSGENATISGSWSNATELSYVDAGGFQHTTAYDLGNNSTTIDPNRTGDANKLAVAVALR